METSCAHQQCRFERHHADTVDIVDCVSQAVAWCHQSPLVLRGNLRRWHRGATQRGAAFAPERSVDGHIRIFEFLQ